MNTLLALALYVVALTLPRPVLGPPETINDYTVRVGTYVHATVLETNSPSEAVAVLVLIYGESTFRLDVHSGQTLGDHGRAACGAQVHPHVKDWHRLTGTDLESTRRCTAQAIRHLRWGMRDCAPRGTDELRIAYAFAFYGAGHCVEPSGEALRRARKWSKTMALLEKGDVL